jgi:hypothetical protein
MMENNTKNVDVRLTLLEHDLNKVAEVLAKLETTLEKLVDVSTSLKQIIAIHEMKFTHKDEDHELMKTQFLELKNKVQEFEKFRWYAYGAFAFFSLLSPLIYKFLFKI